MPARKLLPEQELLPAFDQWLNSNAGGRLLSIEEQLLKELLSDAFGYNQLYLGASLPCVGADLSRVQRSFNLGPQALNNLQQPLDALCDFEQLPIASQSQDVVVMQHLLDFVKHPHSVLREIERVVVPRGRIVVIGFNPYSFMGLRTLLGKVLPGSFWGSQFLSVGRVTDWLNLLGFEVDSVEYAMHRPAVALPSWLLNSQLIPERITRRIPFGGAYVINAVKHRAGVTPSKPLWQPRALAPVTPIAAARAAVARRRNINSNPID
jgi:SAM-dependent methyltransferase